jgi:hypothetical protein
MQSRKFYRVDMAIESDPDDHRPEFASLASMISLNTFCMSGSVFAVLNFRPPVKFIKDHPELQKASGRRLEGLVVRVRDWEPT